MKSTTPVLPGVRRTTCVMALTFLGACATTAEYAPPGPLPAVENVRTIEAGFDETWTALVNYVSSSFFGIRSFEKASGLLTLSFGTTDIPRFVECGTWEGDGPQRYIERDLGFTLDGQMNLFVEPQGPSRTQVRVTTRYVLRDHSRNVYEFTSNSSATVTIRNPTAGTIPTRTCRSTHAAEKQIITGIGAISKR